MPTISKKIITTLVLASLIMIMFFSFTLMMNGPNERMLADCPFSVMGASLCPQDIVAVVIHHISAYHAFLNVTVSAGLTTLIISLLFAICAVLVIFIHLPLFGPPAFVPILHDSPLLDSYSKKIIRWLSLLENSPSF